jgi:hypothetical protein
LYYPSIEKVGRKPSPFLQIHAPNPFSERKTVHKPEGVSIYETQ